MQELIVNILLAAVALLAAVLQLIGQKSSSGMTKKQKVMLWRILAATVLLLGLQSLGTSVFDSLGSSGRWLRLALYLVDYLVIGYDILRKAYKLMDRLGIPYISCHSVGTIIHMAIDGQYAGHIVISDLIKPTSRQAIQALKSAGVYKTVMLTGDAKQVADQVAEELGVDQVYSQLLPADKVEKVEELLARKRGKEKLAFVGDGINDAPVLGRADIGIAMGAMGSDAAIEAADVVLMDDDPMQIAKAIKISRKCLGIVYQNIVVAIGIKLLCLVLVALGFANMWLAVFADVGVMILAVLNAIRALFVKNL